jgi:glucose/arabinose dehydrogenase
MSRYVSPQIVCRARSANLGIRSYTGNQFPEKYKGAIFNARHRSWNATTPRGAQVNVTWLDGEGNATETAPFATGWLNENRIYLGRPVDVQQYVDGSILVSDDKAGVV